MVGHPLRRRQPAGASDHVVVGIPGERVCDAPATHTFPVEIELGGELVEPPPHAPLGVGICPELPASVAQERCGVELPLADERLGVDGEPRLPGCPQDVAGVEVLVDDDLLTLRGPASWRNAIASSRSARS